MDMSSSKMHVLKKLKSASHNHGPVHLLRSKMRPIKPPFLPLNVNYILYYSAVE